MRWTLHRYIGSPRIVSTRIAQLPDTPNSAIFQVVVKVKSVQSLERIRKGKDGGEDTVIAGPGSDQKQMVEYLVLQRMMLKGKENPWMVWGTTEETKVEDVLEDDRQIGSPT